MRRPRFKLKVLAGLLALALCLPAGGALAATIYYTDTQQHPLIKIPSHIDNWLQGGNSDCLLPSGASNNVVNVDYIGGGSIADPDFIFGGLAENADAFNNTVNISGHNVGLDVFGGTAYNGNAYNNTVNIFGSVTIDYWVFGGRATGAVYGNTINISGSPNIREYIYGGQADDGDAYNNTVAISGTPTLDDTICGGYSNNGSVYGNTLVVDNYRGSTISSLAGFDNYRFIIGDNVSATEAALKLTNAVSLNSATVGVTGVMPNVTLNTGDRLMLLDNTSGTFTDTYGAAKGGFGVIYNFDYDNSGGSLMATVAEKYANPQSKALNEGRLAGLVFLNQKADMLNDRALPHISGALAANPQTGFMPFALSGGGRSHYKTGSSISVEGFSALAGLAYRPADTGLIVGAFFEAGWGDYNSRNSFNNAPAVKGHGDTEYYGGGLLARYDGIFRGLYAQGSLSAGRAKTDFKSADYVNHAGQSAHYDSASAYYSANIGLGYLYQINREAQLDLYGRYLWNRMTADSVSMYGERVKFKAADSHRAQLGLRLNYELFAGFTPYAGTAWDYEFASRAKGSVSGIAAGSPDVKGSTAIL